MNLLYCVLKGKAPIGAKIHKKKVFLKKYYAISRLTRPLRQIGDDYTIKLLELSTFAEAFERAFF